MKKNNIPNDTEEEIEINEKDINNKKELSQSEPMIASNKSKDQEIPKNNFISNNSETDSTKPEELLTSHNYEWIIPSLDNLKRPLPGGISESEVQLTSKKIGFETGTAMGAISAHLNTIS